MSTTAGRRVGIAVLLVLLAGAAGLAALPFGAATVRVGALSALWWYAVVVGPCVAVLVTTAVLVRRRPVTDPGAAPTSAP